MVRIEKIYIGAGGREDPQPDSTGRIHVDDIRVTRPVPAGE